MIQALQHHKTNIRFIEDERTSIIIGTLLHLPTQDILEIVSNAINNEALKLIITNAKHLTNIPKFWPHYPSEGTSRTNYVEPDIVLSFDNFDLIIVAKKDDDTPHDETQWKDELTSYENKYGKKRKIYLIALGNKAPNTADNRIFVCSWYNLLNSIEKEIRKTLKETKYFTDNNKYRILLDCKNAFELLGYPTSWLYDMCDLEYESINIESIKEIKSWKI